MRVEPRRHEVVAVVQQPDVKFSEPMVGVISKRAALAGDRAGGAEERACR